MKSNIEINKDAYDLVAKNYKNLHQELEWKDELERFRDLVSEDATHILDLGCGPGDETIWLAKNINTSQIVGIDISSEMLKLPVDVPRNVKFINDDIVTFIPKFNVQGVWARASIHHLSISQIHKLFKNISKYLDKNGVVGMVNKYGTEVEIEQKQKYGHLLERYFQYINEDFVEQIAKENDFQISQQYIKEDDHKWLVSFLVKD